MRQVEEGVFEDDSIIPRKQNGERLEPGVRVHEFLVTSANGDQVNSTYYTRGKLWLAFYRYAGCPMCASHFDEVTSYMQKFKDNNCVFFAVFDSHPSKIPDRMKQKMGPNVVIVGNDNLGLFEMFGVEKSWTGLVSVGTLRAALDANAKGYKVNNVDGAVNRMPAHILVNPGGEVVVAHYAKNAGDHVPWNVAWDFVTKPVKSGDGGLSLL